jgi:VRR-NUC domain
MKLKRMGVSAGFPDIEIPLPIPGLYHGLYIELKRQKGGFLSDAQLDWLKYLNGQGYHAVRANGFEEAKQVVLDYLALMKNSA